MRTHADIVRDAGVEHIAQLRSISVHTVGSWRHRDSIPGDHWLGIVEAGLATLEELAEAAAAKPRSRPDQPTQAAAA